MNFRGPAFILLLSVFFMACAKNDVSNIPRIGLMSFSPLDSMTANVDTVEIIFSIIDGDGDIGATFTDTTSQIYLKDSRFDSAGFVATPFPLVGPNLADPKKGIAGSCILFPVPQPTPRADSIHSLPTGDTFSYQLYITDRAGHKSNIITTKPLIIKP
jgi:hypothetical protein